MYLLPDEYREYQNGQRVFGLWGSETSFTAAKARVSDETVDRLNEWTESEEESSTKLQSQSSIDRY